MIESKYQPIEKINHMYAKDGLLAERDGREYIRSINALIDEVTKLNAKIERLELETGASEDV